MRLHISLLTVFTAVVAGWLLFSPLDLLVLTVSDDAYYYLNVARNYALGNGFTFDGLHPSNGWHPAWMVIVQSVFQVIDARTGALRAVLLVQLLIGAATVAILFALVRRLTASLTLAYVSVALVLVMAPLPVLLLNGLETTLVLLVSLALVFVLVINLQQDSARLRLLIGFLIGLLFLARLDSAFIVLTLAVWILLHELKEGSLWQIVQRWWPGGLLAGLMAVSYFAWSYQEFGSPMPISGALKSTFPDPHFRTGFLARVPHFTGGLLAAICWLAYRVVTRAGRWQAPVLAIGIGCAVHLAWSIVFMAWGTLQWHFIAYVPVIVLAATDFLAVAGRGARLLLVAAVVLAAAVNLGAAGLKWGHHNERLAAAAWTSRSLPADIRLGLRDAGVFGYFADQQVVNLDGLINGFEFQEAIHRGTIESFLVDSNVQFTADAYVPCDYETFGVQIVAFSKDLPRRLVGEIRQFVPAAEVYRQAVSKPFESRGGKAVCFVIWQGRGQVKVIR
ncbi:MAG: glycosyltransferase family 39 protein [Pseudomonadota bacterium]